MTQFAIGDRMVGGDHPPLVLVELGINHGGDLSVAIQMVDAAASAGAEIIKHQTHVVEDEMSAHARTVVPGNADISIYEIMERCALSEEDERILQEYVLAKGLQFISTPFSRAAADRLRGMNVPAYKIGSGECNNYPLLRHVASFGKPVILSTGMNTIASVEQAVRIFHEAQVPFALLHCTNVYPTPPHLVRLGAVPELAERFPDAVIGLSDHTTSNLPCLGAVALGADILERHFTDRMDRPGPDIVCSMDPDALRELIVGASIMKAARGGTKGPVEAEEPTIAFAFASVVVIAEVAAGDTFTLDNLWVKRPGTGEFPASMLEEVLGRRAACDISAGEHLTSGMLAPNGRSEHRG